MIKKALISLGVLFIVLYGVYSFKIKPMLPILTGYAAKKMCTCTFHNQRSQESIQSEDLAFQPVNLSTSEIDLNNKTVTTSAFGLGQRKAVYKNDLGCVLLEGDDDYHVDLRVSRPDLSPELPWPYGRSKTDTIFPEVDYNILHQAILNAFDSDHQITKMKTRAVVVSYKGELIAEDYANGYDATTPQLGWSMTKSMINALIGIMVKNRKMALDQKGLLPQWTDERKDITINDLLQMQSGLAFEENYAEYSDATRMLYLTEDIVSVAANQPLEHDIGSHWSYSSGTSNILSGILRNQFSDLDHYLRFPYDSLFNPLGMTSAIIETDESGTFIGSSYCYATPRDWARFGQLYLNDGIWNGERILPEGWVNYTRTVNQHSEGIYGAHFWHNKGNAAYPDVPEDLFSCNGFQGQYVFIIPSYGLVVVRMGLSEDEFDENEFLKNLLEAFQPVES